MRLIFSPLSAIEKRVCAEDVFVELDFGNSLAFHFPDVYNTVVEYKAVFLRSAHSPSRMAVIRKMKKEKARGALPIKTVYYKDELADEFSNANIKARKIDKSYVYLSANPFWKLGRFFFYRIIATPIAFLYSKLALGQRVKNKRALRGYRRRGFFLYVNHTQQIGDPFMPNVALFPKSVYMIVHPDNVSMPVLGRITPYLGALPTPTSIGAMKNFRNAVEKRVLEGNCITIYPEAHIWPYYTGIRNFPSTSMSFPVDFEEPSFTMTNTYQKRLFFKRPRVISYIDGPFFPDTSLPKREQADELRNRIYEKMKERSLLSTVEYIRYVKATPDSTDNMKGEEK